ncbi:PAS domain-containing hybrid sensor histidine kinase/response regulator [Croceivirga sp. JEA036]|uniref:PAS domain-containing hybrid sensor histidine kinase/response regulator n=1 Tax=Croceivirga sp. JEA036 TaxID=2721162 RepID=UPI001438DDE8|nr:ATP-binding protein [Croceivirga sp. JEA036]NJB37135.1 response regulator [Croceivirga sp. JEA036]
MKNQLHPLLRSQLAAYASMHPHTDIPEDFLSIISNTYYTQENRQIQELSAVAMGLDPKKHLQQNIQAIVDNLKEVIFETDLEGNWLYLSQAWEGLTGFKTEECLGKPFFQYLTYLKSNDRIKLKQLLTTDFDRYTKTIEVLTINNNRRWLDISLKKNYDPNGQPTGCIGTIWDVTAQKQVERALKRSKNKEIQANRAKDEFLSTISHEIRTPLNAVIGITHLLLLENPSEEQLENLNVLKHSSEHLLSLVNDILDFAKIESGHIEIETERFNLWSHIESLRTTYGNQAEDKGIRFTVNQDKQIPEYLIGDSTRLFQILTNLISNAIKFTKEGEVALNIRQEEIKNESIIIAFEVIDTGIGISMEKQATIFDAFSQANSSTTREYGGTGLGLTISKKLLELMGSTIALKSEIDVGSVFSFQLEFKTNTQDYIPTHTSQLNLDDTNLDGLSILVAEDHKVNIVVIKKFLAKWNVAVDIAENGLIAVQKCEENQYDAIFMDLQMPIMNGYEATKIIRRKNLNIPIIALSASAEVNVKKEIAILGMDGHISKPFNPNTLRTFLQNIKKAKVDGLVHPSMWKKN